jgi:cystathionine gamma-synthase
VSTRNKPSKATQSVWSGEEHELWERATQVPVVLSVGYGYDDLDDWYDVAQGKRPGHIYSRNTNPTVQAFESKVAQLEGADSATSFATGMACISGILHTFLRPGDRVVTIKDTYGGTNRIFLDFLPQLNIDVDLCDTTDHEQIEKSIAKGCKILYLETPTNPTMKVVDIERLARAGREAGALVVVDNTFATPINQNPLSLGADLVLHSATKFLGGHADALGGVVAGSKELVEEIFGYREIHGATLAPMSAYLLLRGMKTLSLRIERQNHNAQTIAEFLEQHDDIDTVYYPGLESHPGHEISKKQMQGFTGMLSFSHRQGFEALKRLLPNLKYCHLAANLGAVETTVGVPRTTSHVESTPEQRLQMGIPEGLVRYSAGIEDVDDLVSDLEQALEAARLPGTL